MKKRLTAMLMVVALLVSLLSTGAMAVEGTGEPAAPAAGTAGNPITATENNVTISKYVSGDSEDGYELTLEAYASNQTTTTTTTTPLDIVLVLDVSGSMDDAFTPETISYTPTDKAEWSYYDIANSDTTYYVKVDDNYYEVEDDVDWSWSEGRHNYEIGYYTRSWGGRDWNRLGNSYNDPYAILYNRELYTVTRVGGDSKLESMQAAVNEFIDRVAESSESHRISIVSFADGADTEAGLTFVNSDGVTALKGVVGQLHADGATNSAAGLEEAQSILSGNGRTAEKVVVMFTDGTPTTASTFNESVASRAVNTAKSMKDAGVTVYTVGIFSGADPSDLSGNNNKYMNAVSSNYPNAEVSFESNWSGTWYYWDYLTLQQRDPDSEQYYFAADDAGELENVFEGIADSITSGTLDNVNFAGSVFQDTLSAYVNFPEGIDESTDIEVKYAPVTAYDTQSETFSFDTPGDLPRGATATVDISGKTISIGGFDYKTYAATYNETTSEYSGGKLVITFPIELDEAACVNDADSHSDGMYPTNSSLSLSYTVSDAPKSTSTDRSPEVYYDTDSYNANGTDITVQVYVDSVLQTDPLSLVEITRPAGDYDYFKHVKTAEDGTLTYDFNYNPNPGDGHDCVDINVSLTDAASNCVVQGITWHQSVGSGSPDDVQVSNGAYTIDNITGVYASSEPDDEVDVKIYLRTAYDVQYNGDNAPDDTYTYITEADIDSSDPNNAPTADSNSVRNWYDRSLLTTITMQPVPDGTEGTTTSGWYTDKDCTGTEYNATNNSDGVAVSAVSGTADDKNVINFYYKSTTNTYTVTWMNGEGQYEQDTGVAHGTNLSELEPETNPTKESTDTTVYTFAGWTRTQGGAEAEALTGITVTDDMTLYAVYTETAREYTVSYRLTSDENPTDASTAPESKDYANGASVTVIEDLETNDTTNSDGVPGTWTFSGWTTDDANVTDGSFTMPASNVEFTGSWTFTPNSYTITVEVENGTATPENSPISVQHGEDQTITFTADEGYALDSVTVDGDTTVFNGEDGTSYVFADVTENHTIKVVYAEDNIGDEDGGDGIPDKYQATIVYKVVNGTWSDNSDTSITYIVATATYNEVTGTWNLTNATLAGEGRPIPEGMKPDATHVTPGTWDETPDGTIVLEGGQTYKYTYTFSTLVNDSYSVTKTAKVGDTVLSGDSYVQVSDTITYTITVENTGNVALSNIILTDTFTGGNGALSFGSMPDGVTVKDGKITITSIAVEGKVEITATYEVVDGDKTLTNTVTYGEDETTTVTTDVADLEVTKTASAESVNVGDTINYTITVKNTGNVELTGVVVDDDMFGTKVDSITVGNDTEPTAVTEDGYTITTLPVGATVTITYSYTTTEADATNGVTNSVTVTTPGDGPDDKDETETDVTDYSVKITPADIVIYTGGDGYGGVIDDNGNLIEASESSGLPEPGYHLDLSADLVQWLTDNGVTVSDGDTRAENLENIIHFEYREDVNGVSTMTRRWNLEYMGIYETDEEIGEPTRYVYRLVSVNDNQLPVRLAYGDGELITDDIVMSENSVSVTHDITIYAGGIEQGNVIAVAEIPQTDGSEAKVEVNCSTEVGTGKLTIRSTVDDGNSNTAINATPSTDAVTAHTNGEVTFYVNDTEVTVDQNRVQLLLDQVSNNADFNAAMGEDAIATVLENNNLSDASYQLVYMDLVDTQNGNAVVTMGVGDSLKIYWPVPDDAAYGSDFYIVHYYEMNREGTIDDIGNAATHQERATVEVVDGQRYVTFDVNSFSPFVLVYETDDGYEPVIPTPDPDDDTEYVPNWLNTEDHFAYIVGYEDGTIKPNNNITRAEVATIFFRLLTDDARARYWSQTNDYTDVAADSWYNNAISTLSNMGIINGYEDGTFQPNASITRAEFTAIATRFFDYTAEYDGAFNDVSRSAWYADCVQAAVDMGLVDGYPDGGFHPNSNITRAEAVTIVNRVLNRAPHEDHLLDEDEMNVWPDNVYGAWYYADMQEATNSHDYDWIRVSGERVEEWTEKLPERDWAALEQEWSSAYSG